MVDPPETALSEPPSRAEKTTGGTRGARFSPQIPPLHGTLTLSLILLVPAVLGVAHLLHRQRPLLALTGAALVLVGVLSSALLHGVQLVQHRMVHPAADREQMFELLARLEGGIGTKVILVGLTVGLFLGWVILSAGLFATRVVPRVIPVAVLASLVLNFAGLERFSRLIFLIGLGWLGVVVVGRRDDGWVPPEPPEGRRAPKRPRPCRTSTACTCGEP